MNAHVESNVTALTQARNLTLPSRDAMLRRDSSVSAFWHDNQTMLTQAWAEWENEQTDLLVPTDDLLDPKLRQAVHNAWQDPSQESAVAELWEEVIPNVYQAQFFDVEKLAVLRKYLDAVSQAGIPTRPPYGIALNRFGAMLDPRSEGYLGAPNFQAFYDDIMNRYMRPIARLLLGTYGYDTQTFGFSIRYNPDKDTDLRAHTDASSATLNININLPDEHFTGNEVDFFDKTTKQTVQTSFKAGMAMIHTGNVPHATHPIRSGQRSNLVLWLYGDRMQVPRNQTFGNIGGASSYGVSGSSEEGHDATNKSSFNEISAKERWTIPTNSKDNFAPF